MSSAAGLEVNTGVIKGQVLETNAISEIITATATNKSTGSTSYVDLISAQITTPDATKLLILFQAGDLRLNYQEDQSDWIDIQVLVNGVEKTGARVGGLFADISGGILFIIKDFQPKFTIGKPSMQEHTQFLFDGRLEDQASLLMQETPLL